MARHDARRVHGLKPVESLEPCVVLRGAMFAEPDINAVVEDVARDQGACLGIPDDGGMQVIALHRADDLQLVAFEVDAVSAHRLGLDPAARRIGAKLCGPALELDRDRAGHVLRRYRIGEDLRVWESILQHVQPEEVIGVVVSDDDGLQRLAAVEHICCHAHGIGPGEGHVHQDRVLLARDKCDVGHEAAGAGGDDLVVERLCVNDTDGKRRHCEQCEDLAHSSSPFSGRSGRRRL